MRLYLVMAAAAFASASLASHASSITYAVNQAVGGYTAQGTVTTDGLVGTLAASDITGFTFTVSDGSTSGTYSFSAGSTSASNGDVYLQGADLVASASDLLFDFGASDHGGVAFTDPSAANFLCFVSSANVCAFGVSGNVVISVDATYAGDPTAGTVQVIGTAVSAPSSVTPEPSAFALLGTGLLGVTGTVRKRFA